MKSNELELEPGEQIISSVDYVFITKGPYQGATSNNISITLTDRNLIFSAYGALSSKKKGQKKYSLSDIVMQNGKPMCRYYIHYGNPRIDINFRSASIGMGFQYGKEQEALDFFDSIIIKLTGGPSGLSLESVRSISMKDEFLGLAKGFGFGIKKPSQVQETVNKKCCACGAPIIGVKGCVVMCQYCDTQQTL